MLKRLVIRLQDGAARVLPTARVDTKAFAFLPTLLRGFRQVIPRARDTFSRPNRPNARTLLRWFGL